ncbi:hypothetical protein L596_003258 [Steinernema carpocapsae]|uniref:Uncharacterized protein n=1 Tax=Steinernema carpocapsae TaxID=34508 RepID=A0A4V6I7Z3_STECR|nr:hypothetical protein L596_003258 [Steinernema carpocapsae]
MYWQSFTVSQQQDTQNKIPFDAESTMKKMKPWFALKTSILRQHPPPLNSMAVTAAASVRSSFTYNSTNVLH